MKRVLLISAIVIIVLVIGAAGTLYWFLSGDGIRRTLEQQASAWLGQPVQIGSARAQVFPRIGLELENVRAGNPARVTLHSVSINAPLRPLLQRRIEDAIVTLADSRIELPLPFSIPTTGEDTATPAGNSSSGPKGPDEDSRAGGIQLVSIRAITLRDITIASRGREVTVSADSSLAGTRLNLQRFTATSGKTALEATGTAELEPALDANLTVKANRLDLDELLALANAFSPPPSPGAAARSNPPSKTARAASQTAPPARVVARITAATARAGDLEVSDLAATVESKGQQVSLSPLTFTLFDGKYDGSIVATLGRTLSASIRSRITNLDVAQLAAYGGAADTVTGRLSGTGTFSGQGADVEGALANARGSGTATMTDGEIRRLDLVRTVVLFFGRPASDAPPASARYERVDLRFSLANQIARADTFALRSPDFDLTGGGTLSMATKALDGRFNMLLSQKLTAQAGTDLVRYTREGDRVVLPAVLGGTLERPRVTIDAKAAITRGLRNETERRLKGLFDGLLK
jgi:uncharacterized protein involved in outer membrane biogenesis